MKMYLRFTLCIAAAIFLTPIELHAQHSGDPKLNRAIEKANSEFIVAMKTGDAATITAPTLTMHLSLRSTAPAFRAARRLRNCTAIDLHALVRHARRILTR